MLVAIWAQDQNGLIGKKGKLPWRLPADLKFFKETTENQTIVMGRKTFVGMNSRPLPNRKTIILTRDTAYHAEGVEVMHSIEDILTFAEAMEDDVFICGGSTIYQALLPHCQKILRTLIYENFTGDAFFPALDWDNFMLLERRVGAKDEKNPYDYQFESYLRK